MAIITGPDGTPLTVDSAALAARQTPYSPITGAPIVPRRTYGISMTAKASITSPTTLFAVMTGATGITTRLVSVRLGLTVATTAAYQPLIVRKYRGASNSTGPSSVGAPQAVPFDTTAPPARTVVLFAAATPSFGNFPSLLGALAIQNQYMRVTTSVLGPTADYKYDFLNPTFDAPVLNGLDELLSFQLESTANNLTYVASMTWTEEPADG